MPNRLAKSTSPYLLQHKENPVDWWEWSTQAFEEARQRDVPILLSVGYAACHWCHVMAHESFEDPDVASVMNDLFVSIKVDREERPDVDSIYMEAVQAMSGHGGWPMTVWMDHEGRPFFAGTYFPKEPRHGIASFRQVMEAVSHAWNERRDDVDEQAGRLVEAISREIPIGTTITEGTLQQAYEQIAATFDHANGGFGGAPKFPQQPVLEFLLRIHERPWATEAHSMLETTLEAMARGGINDQLGGGFARYSVDDHWLVPHFEKMLYDNTQLARLYMWTGIELERPDFIDVARRTLDYMERDLRHESGGFFSSEDADSEGVEGKFYVWTIDEIEEVLGAKAPAFIAAYGVSEAGNFEDTNILHVVGDVQALGDERSALLTARSRRIRPGLDDKIVTAWNGLAIRAYAEAGAALDDERYLDLAREAARFVVNHLLVDRRLMRSWREGQTSVSGFLDDHAGMAVGLFTLYAATGEVEWYRHAMELVGQFTLFAKADGGFYSTGQDSDPLVKRPTDFTDNPLPSGSALAAEALLIASLYTGDLTLREGADNTLASIEAIASNYPSMVGHHLAVAAAAGTTQELAIVGPDTGALARVFWRRYRPGTVLASATSAEDRVPLLEGRGAMDQTLAYVCQNFVCELPTSDPTKLQEMLG